MKSNPSSDKTEAPKCSPFWGSQLGVAAKWIGLSLAWLVIWLVTWIASAGFASSRYLHQNEQEGFWAVLGIGGCFVFGPLGFLLSMLVARRTSRLWLFLAGAAITGIGTVDLVLFPTFVDRLRGVQAPRDPDWTAREAVFRSTPRAPLEERTPEARLLFIIGPGEKKGLIDTQGRIVVEPRFDWARGSSEGRAMVEIRGFRGFVDGTGRLVIAPTWDEVSSFSDGLAVVANRAGRTVQLGLGVTMEGPERGYIDRDGNIVIEPQFAEARPFSEGVAWVSNGRWGLIDRTGKYVIEPRFSVEPASFSEGLCSVWLDGDWSADDSAQGLGYIDTQGTTVIPARFRVAGSFSEGLAAIVNGGKLGFIDRAGEISIPPQFDWGSIKRFGLPIFSEGLAAVCLRGRYGFVDKSGRVVIEPRYESAMEFRDGLAAVTLQGNTGFIDKEGRMIIAPQFNRVDSFESGIARVEVKFGDWGYIRRDGTFLWHPLVTPAK